MTKFKLIAINRIEVSKIADLAFVALMDGEEKIEVTYKNLSIFKIYRDKDGGLKITIVSADDGLLLFQPIFVDKKDINPTRIAFSMLRHFGYTL